MLLIELFTRLNERTSTIDLEMILEPLIYKFINKYKKHTTEITSDRVASDFVFSLESFIRNPIKDYCFKKLGIKRSKVEVDISPEDQPLEYVINAELDQDRTDFSYIVRVYLPLDMVWSVIDGEFSEKWFSDNLSSSISHEVGHIEQLYKGAKKKGSAIDIYPFAQNASEMGLYYSSPTEIQMFAMNTAKELFSKFNDSELILSMLKNVKSRKKLVKASPSFLAYLTVVRRESDKDPMGIQKTMKRYIKHLVAYLHEYGRLGK
jgi:hypothetical protein